MAKRLTKLKVDEVSVVDKGANNKRFLILKQANRDQGRADPGASRRRISRLSSGGPEKSSGKWPVPPAEPMEVPK